MKNKTPLFVAVLSIWAVALFAQSRNIGNEWPTAQGDAQRTNWLRSDPNISVDTLSKPGFELQWKAELEGQRGMKPAVQGVSVNGVTLFTPLSIVTGDILGLRDALQAALKAIIADGTYDQILAKWGVTAGALKTAAINGGS